MLAEPRSATDQTILAPVCARSRRASPRASRFLRLVESILNPGFHAAAQLWAHRSALVPQGIGLWQSKTRCRLGGKEVQCFEKREKDEGWLCSNEFKAELNWKRSERCFATSLNWLMAQWRKEAINFERRCAARLQPMRQTRCNEVIGGTGSKTRIQFSNGNERWKLEIDGKRIQCTSTQQTSEEDGRRGEERQVRRMGEEHVDYGQTDASIAAQRTNISQGCVENIIRCATNCNETKGHSHLTLRGNTWRPGARAKSTRRDAAEDDAAEKPN